MYCLDTSALVEIFDGVETIKQNLEQIQDRALFITPITLCELYKGAAHTKVTEKRLEFIRNLLYTTELLEFTQLACIIFGEDYLKLKRAGKMVKESDLMIASICKAHGKILISTDRRDFEKIPDLKLQLW